MDFKVGDKVRMITDTHYAMRGQIGVIAEIGLAQDGYYARFDTNDGLYYYAYLTDLVIEKQDNAPLPLPG